MNDLIVTPAEMRARAYAQYGTCSVPGCTGLAVCDGLCFECAELQQQSEFLEDWRARCASRPWYEDPKDVALVLFVVGMIAAIAISMAPWFKELFDMLRHPFPWGM